MKQWQKDWIEEKLTELIANTDCDSTFIAKLKSLKIISQSESERLKAKEASHGSSEAAALLYDLLPKKDEDEEKEGETDTYDKLIQALKDARKTGAAKILQQGKTRQAKMGVVDGNIGGPSAPKQARLDRQNNSNHQPPPTPTNLKQDWDKNFPKVYTFLNDATLLNFVSNDDPLKVIVKKPDAPMADMDQYKLSPDDKGYLLLINLTEFDNPALEVRKGADIDAQYMTELWEQLGYEAYKDKQFKGRYTKKMTKGQVLALIERFRKKCEEDKPASVVIFFGSHGGYDTICTSDPVDPANPDSCVTVDLNVDILSKFNAENCPVLIGKPKIFIVNTCQDLLEPDRKSAVANIPTSNWNNYRYAPCEDVIILKSQAPGFSAIRDPFKGSRFVYCLTYVLMEYSKEKSFQEMINMAGLMLKKIISADPLRQVPAITGIGLETLYFTLNPES